MEIDADHSPEGMQKSVFNQKREDGCENPTYPAFTLRQFNEECV